MISVKRNALALLSLIFASVLSHAAYAEGGLATPSNPGYLLVVGKSTDRAKIADYAATLPPIYANLNAHYLAIGGPGRGVTWLEGPWMDRTIIFGKFQNRSDVDTFWWGEPYRAAIRKRDNAGVFSVVALEGISPTAFEGAGVGFLIVMTGPSTNAPNQQAAGVKATQSLVEGVSRSGGRLLNDPASGTFTAMEGDTVFDRFIIAAWPTKAARDSYIASEDGQKARALRALAGISAVASADGVPRNQGPTATAPPVAAAAKQ